MDDEDPFAPYIRIEHETVSDAGLEELLHNSRRNGYLDIRRYRKPGFPRPLRTTRIEANHGKRCVCRIICAVCVSRARVCAFEYVLMRARLLATLLLTHGRMMQSTTTTGCNRRREGEIVGACVVVASFFFFFNFSAVEQVQASRPKHAKSPRCYVSPCIIACQQADLPCLQPDDFSTKLALSFESTAKLSFKLLIEPDYPPTPRQHCTVIRSAPPPRYSDILQSLSHQFWNSTHFFGEYLDCCWNRPFPFPFPFPDNQISRSPPRIAYGR